MTPCEPGAEEIYLLPGDVYFGNAKARIRTLLGSCVAITLWHPHRRVGGMCHYVLPHRSHGSPRRSPDGRYADEAVQMLLSAIKHERTHPGEYEVKLFGGACMFCEGAGDRRARIPERNVECGRALLEQHGFRIAAQDIGGSRHRNLVLDLWSGDVWVKGSGAPAQWRAPEQ